MKSRFLMTFVFIGCLSSGAAFAQLPPVIGEFRSPIVADDDTATTPNFFVFPDAINLNGAAVDPDNTVTPENIIWSHAISSSAGNPMSYELNRTSPMPVSGPGFRPNNPGSSRLAVIGRDDPAQRDNDVRTLTLRNRMLSPRTGPPLAQATQEGILPEYTRVVTLFASDGTTWSMTSFVAYTSKGGSDRFAGPTTQAVPTVPSATGSAAWLSINFFGGTFSSSAENGLCISTPLTQSAFGHWQSPSGTLTLVKDSIYRIRINVETTENLAAGSTPLWDFVIDNIRTLPQSYEVLSGSKHKYSMDWMNWDTHGGANSVGQPGGRRHFDIWWAPLPVAADDWNDPVNGEFSAANDPYNDGRFIFRVLDVASSFVDGQNDAGTICLKSYSIDRFNPLDFMVVETPYHVATPRAELRNIQPGYQDPTSNWTVNSIFRDSTLVANANEGVTIAPAEFGRPWVPELPPLKAGSWGLEILDVMPGDDDIDFSSPDTLVDNWPIDWDSDALYRVKVGMQAPDLLGETNPPDVIGIAMEAPTFELSMISMISAGANLIGLPKLAHQTDYTAFFHSGGGTRAVIPEYQKLRPRVMLMNIPQILSGGRNVNNGGVTLKYMKVEKLVPVE